MVDGGVRRRRQAREMLSNRRRLPELAILSPPGVSGELTASGELLRERPGGCFGDGSVPVTADQNTRTEVEDHTGLFDGAKDSPPIVWLARLGGVFVVFQVYVYLRWIFSDRFTPMPSGPDPVPGSAIFWVRFWEIGCVAAGVGLVWWIIRKTRRDGEFPAVGVFVVAWLLAAWQDVGVNATRPVFAYNSAFSTWAPGEFIPGWVSKGAENPQPIIYFLASYIVLTPLAIMGIDTLIVRMRKAVPRLNRAGSSRRCWCCSSCWTSPWNSFPPGQAVDLPPRRR